MFELAGLIAEAFDVDEHQENLEDDDEGREVYVSECCGATFVPGHGPDNLVEPVAGDTILGKVVESGVPSSDKETRRVFHVGEFDVEQYDAIREGECPACGLEFPGLERIA